MVESKLRSIRLREHEVRKLLKDGELLLVRPLKPQPDGLDGPYERGMAPGIGSLRGEYAFMGSGRMEIFRSPIGHERERRIVKEVWRVGDIGHGPCIEYRAGGLAMGILDLEKLAWAEGQPTSWRSASQLPAWGARLAVDVASVEIKPTLEMTQEEAANTGVEWHEAAAEDRRSGATEGVWIAPGTHAGWMKKGTNPHWHVNARGAFRYLFDHHARETDKPFDKSPQCWFALLKRVG